MENQRAQARLPGLGPRFRFKRPRFGLPKSPSKTLGAEVSFQIFSPELFGLPGGPTKIVEIVR